MNCWRRDFVQVTCFVALGLNAGCSDDDSTRRAHPEAGTAEGGFTPSDGPVVDASTTDTAADVPVSVVVASVERPRCDTPVRIDTTMKVSSYPVVAANTGGVVVSAWHQIDDAANFTPKYVARVFHDGQWDVVHELDMNLAGHSGLAIDRAGNALFTWIRGDNSLVGARWAVAGGWSPSVVIAPNRGNDRESPFHLGANGDGKAIYVWSKVLGDGGGAFAAQFNPTTNTWGAIETLDPPPAFAYAATVPVAPSGDAVAVWFVRTTGAETWVLKGRSLHNGVWSAAVGSIGIAAPDIDTLRVGLDPNGSALVLSVEDYKFKARVFVPANPVETQWQQPTDVTIAADGTVATPVVVSELDGNLAVAWNDATQVAHVRRRVDGQWQPAQKLGMSAAPPVLSADFHGNLSLVTKPANGLPFQLRRVARDATQWTLPTALPAEISTNLSVNSLALAHDINDNVIIAATNNGTAPVNLITSFTICRP